MPVPATVVMMPVAASTLRMRWPSQSLMYRLPAASALTSHGMKVALVAGPPSPRLFRNGMVTSPVPATVVMMPWGVTLRMR